MKEHQSYIPKEECVSLPMGWNEDSPSGMDITRLAQEGRSFDFLLDEEEDIYNIDKDNK